MSRDRGWCLATASGVSKHQTSVSSRRFDKKCFEVFELVFGSERAANTWFVCDPVAAV